MRYVDWLKQNLLWKPMESGDTKRKVSAGSWMTGWFDGDGHMMAQRGWWWASCNKDRDSDSCPVRTMTVKLDVIKEPPHPYKEEFTLQQTTKLCLFDMSDFCSMSITFFLWNKVVRWTGSQPSWRRMDCLKEERILLPSTEDQASEPICFPQSLWSPGRLRPLHTSTGEATTNDCEGLLGVVTVGSRSPLPTSFPLSI